MKSKPGTYILLAAALAVWGVIAWKIINRGEPELPAATTAPPRQVREKNPRDTLWLDYRDPFLGNVQRNRAAEEFTAEPANEEQVFTPDFNVRYYGKIIKNRVASYIVEIDGEQHLMKRGDGENGYRLVEAYDDSLRLTKDGHSFTVPLAL